MQEITPFLWFDNQALEAAKFYLSVFKKGKILRIARYAEAGRAPAGSVMTVEFRLFGRDFVALNGGPHFKFNEAVSFVVGCTTQREIDYYWRRLTAGGGKPSMCGWLKDRYGLSWQIVPTALNEAIISNDRAKATRVTQAMLQMTKIDLKKIKAAAGSPRR